MEFFNIIIGEVISFLQKAGVFITEFFKGFGNVTQMFNEGEKTVNFITKWLSENVITYVKPIFFYMTNFLIQAFDFIQASEIRNDDLIGRQ